MIPTYNRLPLVQQAIASVVSQSYTNWELIVADDGSDDGTPEVVRSLNNSLISILPLQHTGNIARTRNAGARAGTGSWIAFLDSDDVWVPHRLEIQIQKLLREGKNWGYGGFELMNREMRTIPNKAGIFRPLSGWIAKEVLTTEASVAIGTLLLERTLFEEVGGFNPDPDLVYREDYELVLRLSLKAETLAIPDILVRIREHEGRSTNAFEYAHERTASVYEHFIRSRPEKDLLKIARRRMAGEIAESAVKNIKQKKYLLATKILVRAMINGDRWRHLLSVVRRGFAKSVR